MLGSWRHTSLLLHVPPTDCIVLKVLIVTLFLLCCVGNVEYLLTLLWQLPVVPPELLDEVDAPPSDTPSTP
jgi:hypothetical protein